eukprot:8756768-Pyramimonas_sp.AAC.1
MVDRAEAAAWRAWAYRAGHCHEAWCARAAPRPTAEFSCKGRLRSPSAILKVSSWGAFGTPSGPPRSLTKRSCGSLGTTLAAP